METLENKNGGRGAMGLRPNAMLRLLLPKNMFSEREQEMATVAGT